MNPPISFTLFNNMFDNKTHQVFTLKCFKDFERILKNLANQPGYKPKKGEYVVRSSKLITPAIFHEGTTRGNVNVKEFGGFIMLDIDEHSLGTSDDLRYSLSSMYPDLHFLVYSTSSSTFDHPKFRMIIPLTRIVPAKDLHHLVFVTGKVFGELIDPQTKDIARMYFVPGQYKDAHNFLFVQDGYKYFDVDALFEEYPFTEEAQASSKSSFVDILNPTFKNRVIARRQVDHAIKSINKIVTWSTYLDCPFVNQDLINQYKAIAFQDGSGRYKMIYKIMTSIAALAIKNNYPITPDEIILLIRQLDQDTANLYKRRKLNIEANRAIAWAYQTNVLQ